jgi:hypothetical protein
MADKLYVCLNTETFQIDLLTRTEVDGVIKDAEEFDGALPFTVVGNFVTPALDTPFLIVAAFSNSLIYDVIEAKDAESAAETFLKKKRFIGKQVKIRKVQDLTVNINEYYS